MQHEIPKAPAHASAAPPWPEVKFQDSRGTVWGVTERERLQYDRRRVRMLVFESSTAVRCVRDYPADWRKLDPAALEALSWQT